MQADPLPLETLRMMQYQAWQQMARGEKETPNLWIVPQSRNLMKFVCFLSSFFWVCSSVCIIIQKFDDLYIFIFSTLRLGMLCFYPLVS